MNTNQITTNSYSSAIAKMLLVFSGALFVALCAKVRISLGFTPVPITLQVFGVLLVGLLLGGRVAAASMALYLSIAATGCPIFATAQGGLEGMFATHKGIVGPTLGYLAGFIPAAMLTGRIWERSVSKNMPAAWLAGIAGICVIYAAGFSWYAAQRVTQLGIGAGLAASFAEAVAPFVLVDVAKAITAATIASTGYKTFESLRS